VNRNEVLSSQKRDIFNSNVLLCVLLSSWLLGSCTALDRASYGGTGEDEENRRRAAATCRDYADRQHVNVLRVVSSRPLGAGNDYEVQLNVLSRGGIENVICYTDVRTGSTRIAN
jgi:hypothetical protein